MAHKDDWWLDRLSYRESMKELGLPACTKELGLPACTTEALWWT